MSFCNNCGSKIENVKFCPNCGEKVVIITENKIDKSVNYLKDNIQIAKENLGSINSEIKESVVVNNLKNKTIPKIKNQIIDILGIIGLLIIIGQVIGYFVTNNIFHFQEASIRYNNSPFENYFSGFIAEILPTTILPFVFMFLSGLRKKWLFITSVILLLAFVVISNEGKATSKYLKEKELNENSTIDTINQTQGNESNYENSSNINNLISKSKPNLIENENIRIVNNSNYNNQIDFSFIKEYQNQYAFDEVCNNSEFNTELKSKFGNDLFELFLKYIAVQTPIRIENQEVFISACFSHSCGYNESALFVDFVSDTYYAGILDEDKVYIATNNINFNKNEINLMPNKMLNWIKMNIKE
ncbi:hypothetical protein [Flavobacterium sp.]|uniref:hypothetical protein n=1 Tax=Flavobacterium sp. TaxID=239 RepID=UPI003753C988